VEAHSASCAPLQLVLGQFETEPLAICAYYLTGRLFKMDREET